MQYLQENGCKDFHPRIFDHETMYTPLEDQKPSHICISAEWLHPFAATCQDEHEEWLSCKLSLQQ